jgi:hypothetical protein
VPEKPPLRIWCWKVANIYFRLTRDATMQKLTPEGWVPADPYYLWRAIQDPEFDDVDEAPESPTG